MGRESSIPSFRSTSSSLEDPSLIFMESAMVNQTRQADIPVPSLVNSLQTPWNEPSSGLQDHDPARSNWNQLTPVTPTSQLTPSRPFSSENVTNNLHTNQGSEVELSSSYRYPNQLQYPAQNSQFGMRQPDLASGLTDWSNSEVKPTSSYQYPNQSERQAQMQYPSQLQYPARNTQSSVYQPELGADLSDLTDSEIELTGSYQYPSQLQYPSQNTQSGARQLELGASLGDSTDPEIEIINSHQHPNQFERPARNTQSGVRQPALPLAAGFTGPAADQHPSNKRMHPIVKHETVPNTGPKFHRARPQHNPNARRVTARLSQAPLPSDEEQDIVAVVVSHEAWFSEKKDWTPSQLLKPVSRRPVQAIIWKRDNSGKHDTGVKFCFNVDAYHVSVSEMKEKAIALLNKNYNRIGVYLANVDTNPQMTVKWLGLDLTQGGMIKDRFDLDEPARWTEFIKEIKNIKHLHHIGLFVQMIHPDSPTQTVSDEALRAQRVDAATRIQNNPGLVPDPLPIVLPVPNSSNEKSETVLAITKHLSKGPGSGTDHCRYNDPTDSKFWVTCDSFMIRAWADAAIECRRLGTNTVTLEIPPKTPQFKTYLNGRKPAVPVYNGSTVASTSAVPIPSQLNFSTNTDERIYDEKYCGKFERFLAFARIPSEDKKTRDQLALLGFNHWSDLQPSRYINEELLVHHGILPGTASRLISSASRFSGIVEQSIRHGSFQPSG